MPVKKPTEFQYAINVYICCISSKRNHCLCDKFDFAQVRVVDGSKYRKVHEDVMKKLDKLENEFLPQVMVDNTEVIFDTLRFLEEQTKELIIANTGQVCK